MVGPMFLKNIIRKALTKTVTVQLDARRKKVRHVEVSPSERLVYGVSFAIVSLIALTALEITHLIILQRWSTEIFSAITLLIGTILGAFFGAKS